jgi:peptidoglycan/LPS O-acetylase OafA/YrhL
MGASRFPIELIHNGFLAPAQGLLIVGLAYGGGIPARVLAWRPLRGLGQRSLAIYLLHLPILAWIQALGFFPRPTLAENAVAYLAYLALTLGASVLVSDRFVDPAAGWLRRRFGEKDTADTGSRLPALAAVATVTTGG